jgi:hypothetical protein
MFLEMKDGGIWKGSVRGSAINSKGATSNLMSMNPSAIKDILSRAVKDSGFDTGLLDAIEVNACGSYVLDPIEFGIIRTSLASEEDRCPIALRNAASVLGSTGAVGGLVGCARALVQFQAGAHGPCLHLRELFANGFAIEPDGKPRVQIPTETLQQESTQKNSAGVTSFGGSGTNVHHILVGSLKAQVEVVSKSDRSRLNWFPSGLNAALPPMSYHLVGSWNAYRESSPMEFEGDGVYGYTVTMGENLFETFLFWIEGDKHQVMHPERRWSGQNSKVSEPEAVGRETNWLLDARRRKVTLVSEVQHKAIEEKKAADIAAGKMPEDSVEYQLAFREDMRPPGYEGCDVSEMPVLSPNEEFCGVPGDRYRIRLETLGSFKKVTWTKLLDSPERSTEEHTYYVTGDHNNWKWQEMRKEKDFHVADITCIKPGCTFQIIRDKDYDQSFYPKYPALSSTKSSCEDRDIAGPDGEGLGKKWVLPNKIGDVYEIKFARTVKDDGEDTKKSLTWKFQKNTTIDFAELAKSQEFDMLISSQKFQVLNAMDYVEESQTFRGYFQMGHSGKEEMIIVMNQNWLAAVHPNVNHGHFLDENQSVEGPEDLVKAKFWLIGGVKDRLKPGDLVCVDMKMENGVPKSVTWGKATGPPPPAPPSSS